MYLYFVHQIFNDQAHRSKVGEIRENHKMVPDSKLLGLTAGWIWEKGDFLGADPPRCNKL